MMSQESQTSRRDFLATSAKVAAAAGVVSAAGCAQTRGPALAVAKGPEPKPIEPGRPLRIGFIGVGGRGNNLLDEALTHQDVTIQAVADPDEANLTSTLGKIKKARGQTPETYRGAEDYKKLLAREDIDAAMIAVPCHAHAELYLAAFAAGRHFYGEKPMCIAVNEADALVEAQNRNPKVICQIGFQRRGSAYYQEAMKRLHDGMIGEVFEGRGSWRLSGGPLGKPGTGTQIWFGRRKMSGDWMLEQACHTWDVFCWAAGAMPLAAAGCGRRDIFKAMDPDRDVTDFYFAHLEFPKGLLVDFEHNWCCPRHDDHWRFNGVFERFVGTKGGIGLSLWPPECSYYPREEEGKPTEIAPPGRGDADATQSAVARFFDSVRTGKPPVSGVKNGRMATLTGLLVRKAVDENRRVEMKDLV